MTFKNFRKFGQLRNFRDHKDFKITRNLKILEFQFEIVNL